MGVKDKRTTRDDRVQTDSSIGNLLAAASLEQCVYFQSTVQSDSWM